MSTTSCSTCPEFRYNLYSEAGQSPSSRRLHVTLHRIPDYASQGVVSLHTSPQTCLGQPLPDHRFYAANELPPCIQSKPGNFSVVLKNVSRISRTALSFSVTGGKSGTALTTAPGAGSCRACSVVVTWIKSSPLPLSRNSCNTASTSLPSRLMIYTGTQPINLCKA